MGYLNRVLIALPFLLVSLTGCDSILEKQFRNPPEEYKPMPFWHINGELTTEGIQQQMKDAKELAGFSGISLLPLASRGNKVGTSPKFLSEAYFDRFQDVLNTANELDMEVILYDDNDFPSGMAGGKMEELYPELCRKRLDKIESDIISIALNDAGVTWDSAVSSKNKVIADITREIIEALIYTPDFHLS